jgi:hypothetical protein
MSAKDFELTIICSQEESKHVIEELKRVRAHFEMVEERGFAPATPDVAIKILVTIAEWLPIIIDISKALWQRRKAYMEFETRHRLARRMLADLGPLYPLKGEDTPEYSYYEFKTSKCKHYWEMEKGEIRHGPLRCR